MRPRTICAQLIYFFYIRYHGSRVQSWAPVLHSVSHLKVAEVHDAT